MACRVIINFWLWKLVTFHQNQNFTESLCNAELTKSCTPHSCTRPFSCLPTTKIDSSSLHALRFLRENDAFVSSLVRPIARQESGQLVFDEAHRDVAEERGWITNGGRRDTTLGPVYSFPAGIRFPSLHALSPSLPSPPRHWGLPSHRRNNVNCRCQRKPPPVAIGVPDIYRVVPSRLPHHRPPFVYQWRARVQVYVRTLTRDHASPPRTRGGIARPRHASS